MTSPMPAPSSGAADLSSFTIKAVMAISAGVIEEANVNAANIVSAANADASNRIRSANNELRSKQASLARYKQSVNNQRVLDNTGQAVEAALINYRRSRDSATQDNFEQQIAFAEQAGAQAAASAFSGLQGGVADIVNGTTALRKARLQQRAEEALRQSDYDAGKRQAQMIQAGLDNLDFTDINEGLDYGRDVAIKQQYSGSVLGQIIGAGLSDAKGLGNIAAGAKSFFSSSSTTMTGPGGLPADGRIP